MLTVVISLLAGELQAASTPFLRNHLEQLGQQQDYTIGGEPFIAHRLLATIYSKNQFQLLWYRNDSVSQLFDAISSSSLEGLSPDDYHLQPLLRLKQKKDAGMDYPTLNTNYDLLLTDAFIRLAYDKSFGKVDPRHLDPDWNLPEKTIKKDPALRIEKAIVHGTIREALSTLSPQSPIYERLKKALARYRSIQEQGVWPVIGGGQTLKPGMRGKRVQSLRERLFRSGDLAVKDRTSPVFDKRLQQAVRRFQRRHYLDADGIVGGRTLAELNIPVQGKINQIRVNLERARWILHDLPPTFLIVDIAGYKLSYYFQGKLTWETRVVVGLPYHTTPTFSSAIQYLVINPTWTIPRSIVDRETLPKIQKDPGYMQKHMLSVIDYQGNKINPATINWMSHTGKSFPYLIRQEPGPHNALGRIKFIFPNRHSVYLHDTPHRELFSEERRAFSHGCIRVDEPLLLGELILENDGQNWDRERIESVIQSRKITTVRLKTVLPVMLLYWTVNVASDKGVLFKQDIYKRDQSLLDALDGTFQVRPSVVEQARLQSQ